MQNNEKNYEGAENQETKQNKKYYIQQQKRIWQGSFIYDGRKKNQIQDPYPLSPSIQKHSVLLQSHPTLRRS